LEDIIDILAERYSVRGYKDKSVEKEKLDKVLKAAQLAPTGVNKQAFKVYVIDVKKHVDELKEVAKFPWMLEAPLVLCVAVKRADAWTRPWDGKQIADIDATIVMDHMILEATSIGLGTCYIAAFKRLALIKLLNLSDEYDPILLTPLGYPDADPRPTDRKKISELVEYI
jgi:nitroreductase